MWHATRMASINRLFEFKYVCMYLHICTESLGTPFKLTRQYLSSSILYQNDARRSLFRVCGRSARTVFSKRFYVFKSWRCEIGPCLFDCPVSFFLSPKNAGVDHDEHLPSSPLLLCYLDVAYRMDKTAVSSMGYRKPSNCRELVIFKSPITICFILLLLRVSP